MVGGVSPKKTVKFGATEILVIDLHGDKNYFNIRYCHILFKKYVKVVLYIEINVTNGQCCIHIPSMDGSYKIQSNLNNI